MKNKFPHLLIRILSGFSILFLFILGLSILYISNLKELNSIIDNIVNHPYVVSNSMREINENLYAIHRTMKEVAISNNEEDRNKELQKIDVHEQNITQKFKLVRESYLGDKSEIDTLLLQFKRWKLIRNKVVRLAKEKKSDEALAITRSSGEYYLDSLLGKTQIIIDFANMKINEFNQDSFNSIKITTTIVYTVILMVIIISLILIYLIYSSIQKPLKRIVTEIDGLFNDVDNFKMEFKDKNSLKMLDHVVKQLKEKTKDIQNEIEERKTAEEELQEYKNHLEELIENRTSQLNEELKIRQQIELELKKSEEKYKELFEAESDAIVLVENKTGQILDANKAAVDLYGYSLNEMRMLKNTDLSGEPDITKKVTEETPVIKDNVLFIPLRYHKNKDGKVFPVEITGRFFEWENKSVHIAAIRNITQRKKAEDEITKQSNFLNNIIENSFFATWIADSKGLVQTVNNTLCELLQLSKEQIIGKYNILKDDNIEEQGVMPMVMSVFENKKIANFNIQYFVEKSGISEISEGKYLYIQVGMFPIVDKYDNLTNVVCQWIDITELINNEKELKKYQNELENIIKERTADLLSKNAELEEKNMDLERFNDLFVGREFRIKELRDQIEQLKKTQS